MISSIDKFTRRIQQIYTLYDALTISNSMHVADGGVYVKLYREDRLFTSIYIKYGLDAIVISFAGGGFLSRAWDGVIIHDGEVLDKRREALINSIWIEAQASDLIVELAGDRVAMAA